MVGDMKRILALLTAIIFYGSNLAPVQASVCAVTDTGVTWNANVPTTFSTTVSGGVGPTYNLYKDNTSGTLLQSRSDPNFTNVDLSAYAGTSIYLVEQIVGIGCTYTVYVNVNPLPAPPAVHASACGDPNPAVNATCDGELYAAYKNGSRDKTVANSKLYFGNDGLASYSSTFDDVAVSE
jgi:hypothetical protein